MKLFIPTVRDQSTSQSLSREWGRSWLTWSPSWARSQPPHPVWSPPPRSCRGSRQSGACCGSAGPAPSPRRLPFCPLSPSPPHLQPSYISVSIVSIPPSLTWDFLLYQVLEVSHAAGVPSGAAVFYVDRSQHLFFFPSQGVSRSLYGCCCGRDSTVFTWWYWAVATWTRKPGTNDLTNFYQEFD